ncbi:MAG: hypothetical protein Q8N44_09765 [Rubrivivax sp.]|nr:hypothetical protein [Rubrivivax sp.]
MTTKPLSTTLHTTLLRTSENPAGFSASEITGYSPEQVRRAAEALVAAEKLHRTKVTPRRVRYFANAALAGKYASLSASAPTRHVATSQRAKANWSPDQKAIITSRTRITVVPTPHRELFRTNTYLQF